MKNINLQIITYISASYPEGIQPDMFLIYRMLQKGMDFN